MIVIDLRNFLVTGAAVVTAGVVSATITKVVLENKYGAVEQKAEEYLQKWKETRWEKYRLQDKVRVLEYKIDSVEMLLRKERVEKSAPRNNHLIQKAVKNAMMAAHPDCSGTNATAEEFREYKKLWEELKGGR